MAELDPDTSLVKMSVVSNCRFFFELSLSFVTEIFKKESNASSVANIKFVVDRQIMCIKI